MSNQTLTSYLNTHFSQGSVTKADTNTNSEAVASVIATVADVGIHISKLLQKGALADILGEAGNQNVQGEEQKKLDVLANDLLLEALTANAHCAGVASEELDDATAANEDGEILILFDPLDGSSNIDINMSVGTIFSILPYKRQGQRITNDDFLQKGTEQLAAGYILYGPSTMMALCTGLSADEKSDTDSTQGVAMFSLDPDTGEFVLINEQVTVDADTKEYAINGSNHRYWLPPMRRYIGELLDGKEGIRDKDFNTRWVAAMVAEVHRILCRTGIFMYPFDTKDPNKPGKLRLMYEANPMSLLIEKAGGAATDATQRILDIEPTDIHQRVPVVLGSKNEVARVKELHESYDK